MDTSGVTGQAVAGCPRCDLIDAVDLLTEITESQRFLTIINTLRWESLREIDPDVRLLLSCYEDSDVPAKLQQVTDLIESVRKTLT
jgi:hypothetical protein